jgi:hypothetical protein
MAWNVFSRGLRRVGRYDVLKKLGQGSTGSVYKGRDRDNGELVAIKILSPEVATDPQLRQRFTQEFQACRDLDDPHIVRALDFGQDGETAYLVMELVEGQALWEYIHEKGRLPEAEAVRLISQVAQGLHQAHERGMVHRDIKPDNILLTPDGQARLTDFGLVKDLHAGQNLTDTSSRLGTPNFMAPEQFDDARKVDRRSDIYALAATLYMAVTGKVPFNARGYLSVLEMKLNGELVPPRELVPRLSLRTEAVILNALSVQPERRPATCLALIQSLAGTSARPPLRQAPAPAAGAAPPAKAALPAGKERRAAVRYRCKIKGKCRLLVGDDRMSWHGDVQDVSRMGIGLVLSRRFEPGTALTVELDGVTAGTVSTLWVRVVRVQKEPSGQWLVGCQLAQGLSPEDLQTLCKAADAHDGVPARLRVEK